MRPRGRRAAAPPSNSVAVLYFENRSRDTSDLALADGLTEEIIDRLSGIERLTVRSRYLVRRYRGATLDDPAAAGRTLNVAYLVSGTVRRAGGRLRVSAELVRAADGAQVWGQQFDQPGDDVFAIQEEVAQDVATGIVGRLLPAEARALAARPTASTEAFDAYTLGRFYWNKRTAADLVRASEYFQQAIRADSSYAQAWSGLADSYVLFIPPEYDVPGIDADSILTLAEAAARRAIALAPRLGEAYASLGEILDYRGRGAEAVRAFEQGVAFSPRYHGAAVVLLLALGQGPLGRRGPGDGAGEGAGPAVAGDHDVAGVRVRRRGARERGRDDGGPEPCPGRGPSADRRVRRPVPRPRPPAPGPDPAGVPARHADVARRGHRGGDGAGRAARRPGAPRAAVREIAAGAAGMTGYWRNAPILALGLILAYQGDDAAFALLDGLVGPARAASWRTGWCTACWGRGAGPSHGSRRCWRGWDPATVTAPAASPPSLAARLHAQCPDGTPPPCGRPAARASAPPANSVAVLYFETRSSDTSDLALAEGLTEEIIGRLSGIGRLTVRSRYLVQRFRGGTLADPAAAGRSLNVTYLVSGTVRRAGGRLRVSAELVRAANGAQVWGQQFDQPAGDVFAIQEEVAQDVATGIVGRLLPAEARALAERPTASTEAFDAYTLGRFYWNKRTAADLVRASEYFQQAIRADSSYAQAWSGLADSYVLFIPPEYDVPGINTDSILTLAEAAARRAIALAPRLGEAYASLGEILDYRERGAEAGRAFEQGVALSPRYPTAHQWYSYWLLGKGRWDEGVREMERAKELDPQSLVITTSLVFAYDGAERGSEAETMADQCRALGADHPLTVLFADLFHDLAHRHLDRIPAAFRRAMLTWPAADTAAAAALAARLADPARRAAAVREIAAGAAGMTGYWRNAPILGLGLILAYQGDEAAFAFLDGLVGTPRAAELADWMAYGLLGPRRRAEPRFQAVLARLGIPRP